MPEAEALLRKGLTLVSHVADSDHRKEHELDLQIALGLALSQTQGFHAHAAGDAYSRARQLCDELKRPRKLLPILYGQWVNSYARAELDRAEQFATEILSLGELADDVITRVVGYRVTGGTSLFRGDFPIARSSLEQGLKLYDPSQRSSIKHFRCATRLLPRHATLRTRPRSLTCSGVPGGPVGVLTPTLRSCCHTWTNL